MALCAARTFVTNRWARIGLAHGCAKVTRAISAQSANAAASESSSTASRSPRRFAPGEDTLILEWRRDHKPWNTIAERLGRSLHSVSSRYHNSLVTHEPNLKERDQYTSAEDSIIVQRRMQHVPWRTIAREIGHDEQSVQRRFRLYLKKSAKLDVRSFETFTAGDDAQIMQLKATGVPWRDIAAAVQKPHAIVAQRYCGTLRLKHALETTGTELLSGSLTAKEDAELIRLKRSLGLTWFQVTKRMRRTYPQLSKRLALLEDPKSEKPPRPHRGYRREEDARLLELREQGLSWSAIASDMPHRTRHSLRFRYSKYLDHS